MNRLVLFLILGITNAGACELNWTYNDVFGIDGFRIYQGSNETGTAPPDKRKAKCVDIGIKLLAGAGTVTMTAFKDTSESAQSAPATYELSVPGSLILKVGL